MGLLSKFIKRAVGGVGNFVKDAANAYTGGKAGVLGNKVLDLAETHSGLLGKVARKVGKTFLPDKARNWLSNAADKALKYIPSGRIKDTLTKINDTAQNRSESDIQNRENAKIIKSVNKVFDYPNRGPTAPTVRNRQNYAPIQSVARPAAPANPAPHNPPNYDPYSVNGIRRNRF